MKLYPFVLLSTVVNAAPTLMPVPAPTLVPVQAPTPTPTQLPTTTALSYDDVSVNILGHSGKMTITTTTGKEVVIDMDSIYEMNSAGSSIGNSGPNSGKHSLNTFASQDFVFSDPYQTTVSGLSAKAVKFNTSLVDGEASLEITTFIFLEAGSITPTESETFDVFAGTVKFNIQVDNWPFCQGTSGNPCSGEVGVALDVGVTITGTAAAVNSKGGAVTGSSGLTASDDDPTLVLSTELYSDGSWIQMEDGYPLVTSSGSSTESFTFRFANFSSSSMYDPVISFESTSSGGSSNKNFFSYLAVQVAGGVLIGVIVLGGLGYLIYSHTKKVKANGSGTEMV